MGASDKRDLTTAPNRTSDVVRISLPQRRYNCSYLVLIDGSGWARASLSEPLDGRGWELRCYLQDPDGYIIEADQAGKRIFDSIQDFGSYARIS